MAFITDFICSKCGAHKRVAVGSGCALPLAILKNNKKARL